MEAITDLPRARRSPQREATIRRIFSMQPVFLAQVVLLAVYSLLVIKFVAPRNLVEHFDLWYQATLGNMADLNNPQSLVNGFYPIGYPLLLRAAITQGIDVLRFAEFLSWVGGVFVLLAVFGISYPLVRSVSLALALMLLLVVNANFMQRAITEGTDLFAAGLQLLAVLTLWRVEPNVPRRHKLLLLAGAGGLLGCAYLVRYTSLVLLPCALMYAIWTCGGLTRRSVAPVATLLGAFAFVTAIQIVPSMLLHAQPFYNWQPKNVWFSIYGQGDWVGKWYTISDDISLLSVIALDPRAFLVHWWSEFTLPFTTLLLWPLPLNVGWIIGIVGILIDRRLHLSRRILLVSVLVLPMAATALAWLDARVMIVSLALQIIPMAWLAARALTLLPKRPAVIAPFFATAMLVVFGVGQYDELPNLLKVSAPSEPERINTFLRAAGMRDPESAVTNDPYLHATDVPARTRYTQAIFFTPIPSGPREMLDHPMIRRRQFLVLNHRQLYGDFTAVIALAPQSKDLAPLALNATESIYCIMPCVFDDTVPDDISFENGMRLLAHRATEWQGHVTLYLYWTATAPIPRSYKTSVRALGGDGQIVHQVDHVPQLWTFPTNRWLPNETVVDFYDLNVGARCANRCQVGLIVYDEQSMEVVQSLDGEASAPREMLTLHVKSLTALTLK